MSAIDTELVKMQSLNEYDFTQNYVICMFKEKGYHDVRYTGGNEEHGRDVTFYDHDRLGHRENMAAQVKIGNIAGVNITRTVINEAISAYENPFIDPYSHEPRPVHKLFVITSGRITEYALREIKNALNRYPRIHFLDGKMVLNERRGALSQYLEYSQADAIMERVGLHSLLLDDEFITDVESLLVILFNDRGVTELEGVNDLPKLLMGLPVIRERVQDLDPPVRSSILHWFSIKIVTKAWYIYGKNKVFGLRESLGGE